MDVAISAKYANSHHSKSAADINESFRHLPNFQLYVTGYAHPFNDQDTWCDTQSFGVWAFRQPQLTTAFRIAMNEVTTQLNNAISQAVLNVAQTYKNVHYVDISTNPNGIGFNGNRFCEKQTNQYNLDFTDGSPWFWNFYYKGITVYDQDDLNNNTDDCQDVTNNILGLDTNDGAVIDGVLSSNGGLPGEALRPFHP